MFEGFLYAIKPFECPICRERYWFNSTARDCCKGTPAHDAWYRNIQRQVAAAEARKRGEKGNIPRAGLDLKPCPRCRGVTGHWNCPLCDGSGQVPENML